MWPWGSYFDIQSSMRVMTTIVLAGAPQVYVEPLSVPNMRSTLGVSQRFPELKGGFLHDKLLQEKYLLDYWHLGDFQAPLYTPIFFYSTPLPFPLYLKVIVINMTATYDYMKLERVGNTELLTPLFPKVCIYKWWAALPRCTP